MPTFPRTPWTLVAFIATVALVAAIGGRFQPGDWYAGLVKPSWTAPNWLFAPAWTVLYLLIAIAGWEIFGHRKAAAAKVLWSAQLLINGIWSWLFFGLHAVAAALADVLLLALLIAGLLMVSHSRLQAAFWLLVPYLIWVAYAASLNAAILALN
jgi:benzodiazapine receptor